MKTMEYITDYKWKQFRYRYEVPAAILASEFDYQNADEETDGFFKYRGWWYHLDGFMRTETELFNLSPIKVHGYASDSYFSGVVIELSDDGEEYRAATYIS